jgi:hypothetical protein
VILEADKPQALVGSYWHDTQCLYYVAAARGERKIVLENCWTLQQEEVDVKELEGLLLVEPEAATATAAPGSAV